MPPPKDGRRAVLAANARFYAAFAAQSLEQMGGVWRRESYVTCIHPGWERILGWDAIMESWERIFAGSFGVTIRVSDEVTQTRGDVAWVTCTEEIETRLYEGVSHGFVEATNVFERHEGDWYLIHHHGSPRAHPEPPDDHRLH